MRAFTALATALVLAACNGGGGGGDDSDAAVDAIEPIGFDVEVHPDGARLWLRVPIDSTGPECQPAPHFPQVGECVLRLAPMACDPTTTCLHRVAIERNGIELGAAADLAAWWHSLWIAAPLTDGPAELVIDGCGATHRIPLPAARTVRPTLTDLVATSSNLISGTIAPTDGATYSMAVAEGGMAVPAHECRRSPPDVFAMGTSWNGPSQLTVSSVIDHPQLDTPWGPAYIWSIESAPPRTFIVPRFWSDSEVEIVPEFPPTTVTVLVDGSPYPEALRWEWRVVSTPSGFRHHLNGSNLVRITAGDTTDQVSVLFVTMGGFYNATIPHVVPANDVEFSVADDGRFELGFGPITVNGASPRTFAFSMTWNHPLVARPIP